MKYKIFLIFFVVLICSDQMVYSADESEIISLTLEQAIETALQRNRSIINALSMSESRKISLSSAQSAFDTKLYPSANAGLSSEAGMAGAGITLQKRFDSGATASLTPGIQRTDDNRTTRIGVSLNVPLFRGFGKETNLDSVYQSEFSVRTAQRSLYSTRVNVILDTASAVYDIIRQKELVRLFESLKQQLEGHSQIAKIREKVGLATPLDVYRAEIRLKDVEDSLSSARESFRNSEDRLKLILSFSLERPIEVSAPVESDKIRMNLEELIEIALKNRIELEQANDELEEARRRSRIAEHNILPQLDVVMNYNRYNMIDDFGTLNENRWSINLVSNTDFARSYEKAAFQQSQITVSSSKLYLETRQDEIRREVRLQSEFLKKAQERIAIREAQKKQAEGKSELSKIKFDHGMTDNSDVIEAEKELQQANVNLLSMKTEYVVGIYRMRAAIGTLIEH